MWGVGKISLPPHWLDMLGLSDRGVVNVFQTLSRDSAGDKG